MRGSRISSKPPMKRRAQPLVAVSRTRHERIKNAPPERGKSIVPMGEKACRLAEPKQREETTGAWGSSIGGKPPMKR
jgi:hypothetical protein